MSNTVINALLSCDGYCLCLETFELALEYESRSVFIGIVKNSSVLFMILEASLPDIV